MNFAIIGLGFIAEKHIKAIEYVGGKVLYLCDTDANKLVEGTRKIKLKGGLYFNRDWENTMEETIFEEVDYTVILTPNYLHYPMILKARERGSKVICEKPLCLSMDELAMIADDKDVYTTLQLRYVPSAIRKKKTIFERNEIKMRINVHRGDWYFKSWKVDIDKSGGLLMNLGVHYFDLLIKEFGKFKIKEISAYDDKYMYGMIENENAIVRWDIRIDAPENNQIREIKFAEGQKIDLTNYSYGSMKKQVEFHNLHNKVYEEIMKGEGVRPVDVMEVTSLIIDMTERSLEIRKRKGG